LRTVDSIAWLRYASFYEDFTQFSRFAEEILYLGGEKKGENSGG
jgi:transcriptional regulator NrdR family protein